MFARMVSLLLLLALDYLSLSSSVYSAPEGGNEYIQAAARPPFPRSRVRPPRKGGFTSVSWFVAGGEESDASACDFNEKPFQTGVASWYGADFHGKAMANQKPYDMHAATVAHRRLPLGTKVCIRNLANERIVVATVTDRGPYVGARIVDLSKGVAQALAIDGLGKVEIFVM